MQRMNEWKKKQGEKEKSEEPPVHVASKSIDEVDESIVSSSMASSKAKQPEESYASDDFEDVSASASGSGSKNAFNWPTKFGAKSNDSLGSSGTSNVVRAPASKVPARIEESDSPSDAYEEDGFESISKSQGQMANLFGEANSK